MCRHEGIIARIGRYAKGMRRKIRLSFSEFGLDIRLFARESMLAKSQRPVIRPKTHDFISERDALLTMRDMTNVERPLSYPRWTTSILHFPLHRNFFHWLDMSHLITVPFLCTQALQSRLNSPRIIAKFLGQTPRKITHKIKNCHILWMLLYFLTLDRHKAYLAQRR